MGKIYTRPSRKCAQFFNDRLENERMEEGKQRNRKIKVPTAHVLPHELPAYDVHK
jgi:hypothetical protein